MEVSSIFIIAWFILFCFFCYSMFKALKLVPENHHQFPAWFTWLMLIPIVGYVFIWIMMPFGIPNAFKNHSAAKDPAALPACKTIANFGLAYAILAILSFIPAFGWILAIIALVLFFIYWSKVITFRKTYLDTKPAIEKDK